MHKYISMEVGEDGKLKPTMSPQMQNELANLTSAQVDVVKAWMLMQRINNELSVNRMTDADLTTPVTLAAAKGMRLLLTSAIRDFERDCTEARKIKEVEEIV